MVSGQSVGTIKSRSDPDVWAESTGFGTITPIGRGGEVVTRESAKLLCKGSIPFRASNQIAAEAV